MGPRSYKFRTVVLLAEYDSFASQRAPAAAGKTSSGLIYVIKSLERDFCKKSACGNREDLTRLDIYHKIAGTSFFPKRKAPAAAGKTPPSLTHVTKPVFLRISNSVGLYVLRIQIRMAPSNKLIVKNQSSNGSQKLGV